MLSADSEIRTDMPPPPAGGKRRWNWDKVPVGASFEFDGTPEAAVSSFGHYLAAGKYRIKKVAPGRYRFWRLG